LLPLIKRSSFLKTNWNKPLESLTLYINNYLLLILKDNDGYITRAEMAKVMGGIQLDDEQWKKLVESCDENADGQV